MTHSLTSRTALVTGSSRGIGAAIARKLAESGAQVVVHANKTTNEANHVARGISDTSGKAAVVQGDLSSAHGARDVVRTALSLFGSLDILVNNAAIFRRRAGRAVDGATN